LIIAPSAGEFYGGRYVTLGMGARVAGSVLFVYAAAKGAGSALDCGAVGSETGGTSPACTDHSGDALALGGLGLVLAGAVYDIATAPASVRAWNRERHASVQLAPAPLVTRQGAPTMGLGLVGGF
jgi:hypothetical protein